MRAIPSVPMAGSDDCRELKSLFLRPVPSLRTTQPTVVH